MSTCNACRGADFPRAYTWPAAIAVEGFSAAFTIYDAVGGTALLTLTPEANDEHSRISFSGNVISVLVRDGDIATLPLNADITQPIDLYFDFFVTDDLGVTLKKDGGIFRIWPEGTRVHADEGCDVDRILIQPDPRGSLTFLTLAQAMIGPIFANVEIVRILGRNTPNDGFGDTFRRSGGHPWDVMFDGQAFENVPSGEKLCQQLGLFPVDCAVNVVAGGMENNPDPYADTPLPDYFEFDCPGQVDQSPILKNIWQYCAAYGVGCVLNYRGQKAVTVGNWTQLQSHMGVFRGLAGGDPYGVNGTDQNDPENYYRIERDDFTWILAMDEMAEAKSIIVGATAQDQCVRNFTLKDFNIACNRARWGNGGASDLTDFISGDGLNLANCRDFLVENVFVIDSYRHGINPCSYTETRAFHYVGETKIEDNYTYPVITANRPRNFTIRNSGAAFSGDDGVSPHAAGEEGAETWTLDRCYGYHCRATYSPNNSNGVEIDDDCTGGHIISPRGVNCHAALEIKGHGNANAARNIRVTGEVHGKDCARPVQIRHLQHKWRTNPNDDGGDSDDDYQYPQDVSPTAYNVSIESILVDGLKKFTGGPTPYAFIAASYKNLKIGRIHGRRGTRDLGDCSARNVCLFYAYLRDVEVGSIELTGFEDHYAGVRVSKSGGITGGEPNRSAAEMTSVRFGSVRIDGAPPRGFFHTGGNDVSLGAWQFIRRTVDPVEASTYGIQQNSDIGKTLALGNGPRQISGYKVAYRVAATDTAAPRAVFGSPLSDSGEQLIVSGETRLSATVSTAASRIQSWRSYDGGVTASVYTRGGGSGPSLTNNAIFKIGRMETTNRSLDATGTINASGADMAEWRDVAEALWQGNSPAAKGAALGVRADGRWTDVFDDVAGAIRIKSTNPNLVGNDITDAEVFAFMGVEDPGEEPDYSDEAGEAVWSEWFAVILAARAARETLIGRKDRIALCGVVPVVIGRDAVTDDIGKRLVPVRGVDGKIALEVADIAAELGAATTIAALKAASRRMLSSIGIIEKIDNGQAFALVAA